jgi:hypothetical protein
MVRRARIDAAQHVAGSATDGDELHGLAATQHLP